MNTQSWGYYHPVIILVLTCALPSLPTPQQHLTVQRHFSYSLIVLDLIPGNLHDLCTSFNRSSFILPLKLELACCVLPPCLHHLLSNEQQLTWHPVTQYGPALGEFRVTSAKARQHIHCQWPPNYIFWDTGLLPKSRVQKHNSSGKRKPLPSGATDWQQTYSSVCNYQRTERRPPCFTIRSRTCPQVVDGTFVPTGMHTAPYHAAIRSGS